MGNKTGVGAEMPRRFGVEIEGYIRKPEWGTVWGTVSCGDENWHLGSDNSLNTVWADTWIACDRCKGTKQHSNEALRNLGISCSSCDPNGMILNPNRLLPIEIKSAPLRHTGSVYSACLYLEERSFQVDRTAGLHIHVEAADYEPIDFVRAAFLVAGLEPFIYAITTQGRMDNRYCQPLSEPNVRGELTHRLRQPPEFFEIWRDALVADSRYYGFNIESFSDQPTIEFRYFGAQNNAEVIEAYVELVTKTIEFAKFATFEQLTVIVEKFSSIQDFNEMHSVVTEVLGLEHSDKLELISENAWDDYNRLGSERLERIRKGLKIA